MTRSIIVGTAGHIDHGKTTLVRLLTGVDADRLPEEKRRGITIDLGFAELDLDDVRIGFVDVPGHERFVKNMLAGAHGIDAVALVIAADEGVMPQTREHFEITRLLGIERGLVVLTKTDMVDAELLELVEAEAKDLVKDSFLEAAPIVPVSARNGGTAVVDGAAALAGICAGAAALLLLVFAASASTALPLRTTMPESARRFFSRFGTSMNWLAEPTCSVAASRTATRS